MNAAVMFAIEVMKWLPAVKAGVSGAMDAMTWGREALETMAAENRDPTDEEWTSLNDRTADLRDALHTD